MIDNFQSNTVLNIVYTIVTYAPCEYEVEVVKNTLYEQLRTTIKQIPSHN